MYFLVSCDSSTIFTNVSNFSFLTLFPQDEKKKYDPMVRTKIPFGGVINDWRRRFPQYWSDIKDGLDSQCLVSSDKVFHLAQPYQEMYPSSFFRFNYPPDGLPVTIPVFGAQKGSF